MNPMGQLLFIREIPLFSRLADNSTFTPVEETSFGLYRFNWSEVAAGHFLSDVAFIALGFLLLSLAMGYGKHYAKRDMASLLIRAGRVWGALWLSVAGVCLVIGAMDLGRLPIERAVASSWTAIFAFAAAALFALCFVSLKTAAPDGQPRRKSEAIIKISGIVIAVSCASLLHIVDFPPQTALGWVVAQLLILGVPAGVGFLLPNREVESHQLQPERVLKGARYFGALDFALFIPFAYMLIIGKWIIPELNQANIMPLIQALLLAICLLNRVRECEIKEHPRSLFGNVLSAWIALQIGMPLRMVVLNPWQVALPISEYLIGHLYLASAALIVGLVLSLRVLPKGERLERPWWKKARYWVLVGLLALILRDACPGLPFVCTGGKLTIFYVTIAATLTLQIIIRRRDELRRTIRFSLVGAALFFGVAVFALSLMPQYATMVVMLSFVFPQRHIMIIMLVLMLLVLRFKGLAESMARALRGRPARVAVYSVVIVIAFMFRSLDNYPSYPLGSMYYSSSGLTEDDGRVLNTLPPESLATSRFLQQSTFGDVAGAYGNSMFTWGGIVAAPSKFPKLFEYVPRLMGQPSQFVVGAARVTGAVNPSDVRLDVLYSRRVTGRGLADHIRLQLAPDRIRRQATLTLSQLMQIDAWQEYLSYPRAAMETNAPCRSWNSLIDAVVDMAIFSLMNPPGHEALKQLWRLDGMRGVSIE